MSEIDLIRKLEALKEVKPNKEWVAFTKESILNSEGIIDEKPNISIWVRQLTPLTICLCLALTFGFFYTSNTQNTNNIVAENNEEEPGTEITATASLIDIVEEEEPSVAEVEEEQPVEITMADIIEDIEEGDNATDAVLKEIERIRSEVAVCDEQEEYLNNEQKENCETMRNQLEIIDSYTEK